jgi:hypothetical protein
MRLRVLHATFTFYNRVTAVNTLIRSVAGVVLGCLLFANNAFALTYYWVKGGTGNYSSASAACPSSMTLYNLTFTLVGPHFYAENSATCHYRYTDAQGQVSNEYQWALSRNGDSCPVGQTYNELIGGCEAPVQEPGETCADQTGATLQNPYIWDAEAGMCKKFFDAGNEASCQYMASNLNAPTAYVVTGVISSAGLPSAPPTFAATALQCQAQTISSSECTVNIAGEASCNVIATFTGEVNVGGTVDAADDACPDDQCPVKEPKTETIDEGCNPVANGSGGTTCTQTKETAVEGTQQCGSVNGVYTCVAKPPASSGVTTSITATTETEPDGDIKVTTVKSSDLTTCSDINTCTTTHSVTTSSTTTKPSGSTSTTSSCTGSCTSSGGGVETIPGVGTTAGTGTGTCTGDECGEGEEQGTADIAQECAAVPPCDGDPFQCAILRQAHIDTCKLMAGPTSSETAAQNTKINAEYAALDAHQATMDAEVSSLLSGFQSATGGGGSGGGQCLPDIPFSVMGFSQNIEFSKACEPLSFVRLVLLAGAYLMAARIVSKEV